MWHGATHKLGEDVEKKMSEIKFGEVDWNSGDAGNSGSKTNFLRLQQGDNVVRVMGNPVQSYVHWLELPDGSKRKINSPVDSPELVERLEEAGFKRKPSWIVKVLDRKENEFKLLEIGSQIFNGIRGLVNNKKWGKVTQYDITINRGPKGSQPLYNVTPDPKEPIPSELKEKFMAFNDSLNIDRMISPSDPKYVCDLLEWSVPEVDSVDDDDDDTEFTFE
jgi:hypothetical protein